MLPTETMLQQAAQDVAHEMFLFQVACQDLKLRINYQMWYVLARNLMDFFDTLPNERDKDAVLAGDFFHPPGTWHALRETIVRPGDYEDYRIAAHKRAAHLTYARAEFRRPGAVAFDPSPTISQHLQELARLFLTSLTETQQGWFRASGFPLPWKAA